MSNEKLYEEFESKVDDSSEYFSETGDGFIVSMLSDVQELLAMGFVQKASDLVNTVKKIMHMRYTTSRKEQQ